VSIRRANDVSVMRGADAREIKAAANTLRASVDVRRGTLVGAPSRIFFGVPLVPDVANVNSRDETPRSRASSYQSVRSPSPTPLLPHDVLPREGSGARDPRAGPAPELLTIAEQQRPCSDLERYVRAISIPRQLARHHRAKKREKR